MNFSNTYKPDDGFPSLKQSDFWLDTQARFIEFWRIYPTMLECFDVFLEYGNGYEWVNGKLKYYPKQNENIDQPYHAPSLADGSSFDLLLSKNQLFALIPEIPEREFMKYIPDNVKGPESKLHVHRLTKLRAGLCDSTVINRMPFNVNLHYLAAGMMMLKHLWLNRSLLPSDKYGVEGNEGQVKNVRDALHTGFMIIEERNLEEPFARACADLAEALPELTLYSTKYFHHQQEYAQFCLTAKDMMFNDYPPEHVEKMGAVLRRHTRENTI
ncbi:MAG: hypothetical protein WC464_00795 [Bdellovibrionales bacterium]